MKLYYTNSEIEIDFVKRIKYTVFLFSIFQLLDECSRMQPTNPYAASKAAAEAMVSSFWQAFKVGEIKCKMEA